MFTAIRAHLQSKNKIIVIKSSKQYPNKILCAINRLFRLYLLYSLLQHTLFHFNFIVVSFKAKKKKFYIQILFVRKHFITYYNV